MSEFLVWLSAVDSFMYPCLVVMIWFLVSFFKMNSDDRWVAVTVILYGINDIVTSLMAFYKMHNLWFYNLMLFPQFIMVITLLIKNLYSRKLQLVLLTGGALLILFHTINLLFLQGIHDFNNFTYIPAAAWMAVCAFFYLREQMEISEESPFDKLLTWFAFAMLIDQVGSIPILSVLGWTDYIQTQHAAKLWDVVELLYTFWYLLILLGLVWTRSSLRSALRLR